MFDVKDKPRMVERAILVGVYKDKRLESEAQSLLDELEELVGTLSIGIKHTWLVKTSDWHAGFLMTTGKAQEIADLVKEEKLDCVIFDNELSPSQQRKWETLADVTTLDRQEVIIDIFAQRARTKEAQLQVELARMQYALPRLKRHWTHFGRQGGATGGGAARGEGETQIEVDRRLVHKRIDRLKSELVDVRKIRANQRKERLRTPVPTASIVGYTNAGKSTLLNHLTGSEVLAKDMLFATLDPTTRRIELPNGAELLLTDTVGFIRNLPHRLVDAFKATLEEAVIADFLVHVLDASAPEVETFEQTTLEVLKEIGVENKEIVTVFNKIDLISPPELAHLKNARPEALFISLHTDEGMEALTDRMADLMADRMVQLKLHLPHSRADLMSLLHKHGRINESKYEYEHVFVCANIPVRIRDTFTPFLAPES